MDVLHGGIMFAGRCGAGSIAILVLSPCTVDVVRERSASRRSRQPNAFGVVIRRVFREARRHEVGVLLA